jgi:type IV secretion system protein TrbL
LTVTALSVPVIGPLIRDTIGNAVKGIVDVIAAPVASAAAWILQGVGDLIDATTRPQLDKGWFQARYSVMVALAVLTLVGMLAVSAMHAVVRQDPGLVLRVLVVQLPMAVILTGAAAGIVQWSLSLVDLLCNAVTADTGHDVQHLFTTMETYLMGAGAAGVVAVPAFVTLVVSLIVVLGGLLLWMELLLRSLAVDAATLFLPLAMVTLAWPAASRIARRLAETIAALVLSKLVIVGVLSLAVGALAAGGFGSLLTGMGLLLLAAGAPYTLLRLIPMAEFGAVAHMEGLTRRATVRPALAAWNARSLLPVAGGGVGPGYVGPVEGGPGGTPPAPGRQSSPGIADREADWFGPLSSPGAGRTGGRRPEGDGRHAAGDRDGPIEPPTERAS